MRLAQPVLRRMLRMWLAAVCSLMNSSAPISRLLRPRATRREDLRPRARRARRAGAWPAPAAPSARTRPSSAGMPIALGERRRLAEQRAGPVALAGPRASSKRAYS